MTTTVDPDLLRALDPRRSYLPAPQPAAVADAEAPAAERAYGVTHGGLASLSTDDLRREIDRRQNAVGQRQAKREKLAAELAEIDEQLRALGVLHGVSRIVQAPARQRLERAAWTPRARNSVSLADALAMAVEPRAVVSPAEAATLVQANGYVSNAKKLGMTVANALARDARFKRVGRGQYERLNP